MDIVRGAHARRRAMQGRGEHDAGLGSIDADEALHLAGRKRDLVAGDRAQALGAPRHVGVLDGVRLLGVARRELRRQRGKMLTPLMRLEEPLCRRFGFLHGAP